jgi:hypothetical protein
MKKIFILFFLSFTFSAFCQVKISEMPSATDLTGAIVPIVQGGVNKKAASTLFTNISANIPSASISVGGITAGTSLTNLSDSQILALLLNPYVAPVFTSFANNQSQTVEVGTTISGSKTFTWGITVNSGVVPTIDIRNNTTSSTLLAATPNDGTQAVTVTTIQLNTNGATQSWRGIGNNTSPVSTFNSSDYVVTARFIRFFGASAASVTNSAQVRALPTNAFHTGASTFTLNTGNTLTKFIVALPPSVTISTVIDIDASNANITSTYILTGTINVVDAGGTNRAYNIYELNLGAPYSFSHQHSITTAN